MHFVFVPSCAGAFILNLDFILWSLFSTATHSSTVGFLKHDEELMVCNYFKCFGTGTAHDFHISCLENNHKKLEFSFTLCRQNNHFES